jgi:hypothetical protein
MDLSITVGRKTHASRVLNCSESDAFKKVREIIEKFAQNELVMPQLEHFSTDKLREMARESYLLGKKLYSDKEISYGNLSQATLRLSEADWYLETVEPKPEFHPDILKTINECKADIQAKYDAVNFRATLAIKMRQWQDAAKELRIALEIVPDRSDPRNQESRKSLLDVERRLNTKK